MLKIVDSIEKFIIRALMVMIPAAILLCVIKLGRLIILDNYASPTFLIDISKFLEGVGLVLIILMAIKLLKMMKMFLTEGRIELEVMVEVAVIALCYKIITLDLQHSDSIFLVGIASLMVGLSVSRFVLRLAGGR